VKVETRCLSQVVQDSRVEKGVKRSDMQRPKETNNNPTIDQSISQYSNILPRATAAERSPHFRRTHQPPCDSLEHPRQECGGTRLLASGLARIPARSTR